MQTVLSLSPSATKKERPYQLKARKQVYQHIKLGFRRPLLQGATGSGKTYIACRVVEDARSRGKRVHWITLKGFLNEQFIKTYSKPEEIGRIESGYTPNYSLPVQVSTLQSLINRPFPEADLVVLDEVQHAKAESYKRVFEFYSKSVILGLTATPIRLDGQSLDDIFDSITCGPNPSELEAAGVLCPHIVFAKYKPDLSQVNQIGGDYNQGSLEKIVNVISSREFLVADYLDKANNEKALVFCVSIQHSRDTTEAFVAAGIKAESLSGDTSEKERPRILERFVRGETRVLCSCDILTEGYDLPDVSVIVDNKPTASEGRWLQILGRGLRSAPGKQRLLVLDHSGNYLRHASDSETGPLDFPWEERFYNPERAKPKAKNLWKTCKKCFWVMKSGVMVCPNCMYVFESTPREISVMDVALSEVQKPTNSEGLRLLRLVAKQARYKKGWAAHVWEERGEKIFTERSYFSFRLGRLMEREKLLGRKLKSADVAADKPKRERKAW
jgi:DNA repair protein RadD